MSKRISMIKIGYFFFHRDSGLPAFLLQRRAGYSTGISVHGRNDVLTDENRKGRDRRNSLRA